MKKASVRAGELYKMNARGFLVSIGIFAIGVSLAAGLAAEPKSAFTDKQRNYWAFQRVRRPEVPQVKQHTWVRNPIDAFLLSRLEARGIAPSAEAAKASLLRRVTYDLSGLPPTPEEMQAFLADKTGTAYEKAVDRLLASPHYGERWARHWLDLARYADSDGFKADHSRPNIWRYRDYVIRAFNSGKPYDRFVREQIAGDELWPEDMDARIATGFHRHYPEEYNAQNLRQRRLETLGDITDTTGAVFLGLTVGCARCHDHKFDPITHDDYYKLQAFFANVSAVDKMPLLPANELAEYRRRLGIWEEQTKSIRAQMDELVDPARRKLNKSRYTAYAPDVQAAVNKPASERTPLERWIVHRTDPFLNLADEKMNKSLKGEQKERYEKLQAELDTFAPLHPGELPVAAVMTELGTGVPPTHTLAVGLLERPIRPVEPGFPSVLNTPDPKIEPNVAMHTSGRRTALANWLVDPSNPLTARVMVNRIWSHHFGRGLVSTPSDLGAMGMRPTHPELLDWLASEFVSNGWSIKQMHHLIVTSNAYRQSSAFRESAAQADSANRLLWRFPRQRLDAEVIRDSALSVAGLLDTTMGGPGVYPELPAGMPEPRGGWTMTTPESDRHRRSVYIFARRNSRYPMLEVFDMANAQESCSRRTTTTTAPQALTLLNSKLSRDWAEAFAARVIREAGPRFDAQVGQAYQLAYSRPPSGSEKDTAATFLHRQLKLLGERDLAGEPISKIESAGVHKLNAAALVDFCHALLNSNEFVYVD